MKVGLGFIGDSPISEIVKYAKDAEKLGLDSLWLHDNMFYFDGLSYLIAASQRTSRIRMGIGCLNPYTRHPFAIGMSLLNLHRASQGRAILGLGTGSLGRLNQIGVKHNTPLDCLREAIDVCRLVWRGDEFNYSGKVFTLNGVKSMVGGSSSKRGCLLIRFPLPMSQIELIPWRLAKMGECGSDESCRRNIGGEMDTGSTTISRTLTNWKAL